MAYAVPTFQAPLHFQQEQFMRSDVETIRNWIQSASSSLSAAAGQQDKNNNARVSLRVASAYLNPTKSFQEMLHRCRNLDMVHYLTAGRISHGFTAKAIQPHPAVSATATNNSTTTSSGSSMADGATTTTTTTTTTTDHHPRRDWIPTLFDATARQVLLRHNDEKWKKNIHLWFYQRPNWTFHAKGLWLTSSSGTTTNSSSSNNNNNSQSSSSSSCLLEIDEHHQVLYGCTHGSGNYGARSEYRDLESNLILTFPARSPLAKQHVEEWNSMCAAAVPWTQEPKQQMSWPLRWIFPWIQSFF
jgi:phosphatidylserine/phosphatidylglycerophosphate/cardiolipin synthase-like enzyme